MSTGQTRISDLNTLIQGLGDEQKHAEGLSTRLLRCVTRLLGPQEVDAIPVQALDPDQGAFSAIEYHTARLRSELNGIEHLVVTLESSGVTKDDVMARPTSAESGGGDPCAPLAYAWATHTPRQARRGMDGEGVA